MERIYQTIRTYRMISPGDGVIAGVSGGADSVCLLLALARYRKEVPFSLFVAHVEHGIRGKESLEDASFVEALCHSLDVPFYMESCDVESYAQKNGMTVEEAGRSVRYACFEKLRIRLKADRIAVAHNQNDQAETVLWNLVRGSGLKGLGGILPVRDRVIRPLLFLERSQIEELLVKNGQTWRTDRTNLELDYTRNRLRREIIPQLEQKLNRQALRHIAQAAQRLQEVQHYVEKQTECAARSAVTVRKDGSVVLLLAPYEQQEELIQKELLLECLRRFHNGNGRKDIGDIHLQQLQELAKKDCGKEVRLPGGTRVVREKESIHLTRISGDGKKKENEKNKGQVICPVTEKMDIVKGGRRIKTALFENSSGLQDEIQKEKKYTKWLSYDTIYSNVCLRTRRSGDYLIVNAQGGRRKLKDYLIDQKIPREERERLWLLADGSHILWIVGWRISEAAKVRQDTKRILKIQIEEESHEGED